LTKRKTFGGSFNRQWWKYGTDFIREGDKLKTLSAHGSQSVIVAKTYEPGGTRSINALNFIVPSTLLLTCIPIGLAWTRSATEMGRSNDANFYQSLAGSILQLLSLATLLYPTIAHSRISGHPWVWTWVLASVSVVCTLLSPALYTVVPVAWSMVLAFAGAAAQALIILQVVHAL
jgi:hypothetical protein